MSRWGYQPVKQPDGTFRMVNITPANREEFRFVDDHFEYRILPRKCAMRVLHQR